MNGRQLFVDDDFSWSAVDEEKKVMPLAQLVLPFADNELAMPRIDLSRRRLVM